MILLVTGITAVIMFISHTNNWLQQSSMFCHSSKKSLLNLLSGHYDIPQNTKVIWDWDEPQTVGKTMSFRVKVSMIILNNYFSSPEQKAHDELIVYQSSRRPSVCPSVHPNVCSHFQT